MYFFTFEEGDCVSRGAESDTRGGDITPELDELSSTLMGDALDLLADGQDLNVLLVVEDAQGNDASFEFSDDGSEALLEGAHKQVRDLARSKGDRKVGLGEPVRYALAFEGAVADEDSVFRDAVLLEFGERGRKSYSAYSLFEGKGTGDGFRWTEPEAAGEVASLL